MLGGVRAVEQLLRGAFDDGAEADSSGNERVALEVAGQLSRSDDGMTFASGLFADKVKLRLDVSAVGRAKIPSVRVVAARGSPPKVRNVVPCSRKRGLEASQRGAQRIAAAATALLASAILAGDARAADGSMGFQLPAVEVKLAPVEIKVPSVEVKLSPAGVQVPSVEVKLPPVDVKLPPVEATVPPLGGNIAEVEAPAPVPSREPAASPAPQAPSGGGAPATSPARAHGARVQEMSGRGAPGPAAGGDAAGRERSRGGSGTRRDPTTTLFARGDRAVPPAVRRRERRLRRLVRRLSGCLGALRSIETRVLTLRAGGTSRRPLSRRQVARRLDIGVPRVAAVERRGLDRLRAQGRAGGCDGPPVPAVASVTPDAGPSAPPTMSAASAAPTSEGRAEGGVSGVVERSPGAATVPSEPPSVLFDRVTGPPLLLLLIGGFLAGFALNWVRESRATARRPVSS